MLGPPLGDIIREHRAARTLDADDLAELTAIPGPRLLDIEANRLPPTFTELKALSRYLGVDLALYDAEEDQAPLARPSIQTLTKSAEQAIPLAYWPAITEAAEIAAHIVSLEEALERPARYALLCSRWSSAGPVEEPAWSHGQALAEGLRHRLGLGRTPIDSMRRFAASLGVVVLETYLPPGFSALCLADAIHGPTIILNIQGANENTFARRFALAHELGHILFDRDELEELERFDRAADFFSVGNKPPVEQRADAFSIHLLAPASATQAEWTEALLRDASPEAAVRRLMERFGVGFTSTRDYLIGLKCLPRDAAHRLSRVETQAPEPLRHAERLPADEDRLSPLPPVRRGALLALALEAHDAGVLGRSSMLELLDIDADTFSARRDTWRAALADLGLA